MPVIAIINRKGGSGKTTLATHVAAWLSRRGDAVMLGDVDRQQSAVPWIKRRQARAPGGAPLVGWAVDGRNVLRPPAGVRYVVLDTPGGLHGFSLSRLLMNADVVLMPICDSIFDRESAAACLAEIRMHPRVATGRVQLAAVGMRVDANTRAEPRLRLWAEQHAVPLVGVLNEGRAYARVAERGLTLFDRSPAKVQAELAQWEPVLAWLAAALDAVNAAAVPAMGASLRLDDGPPPPRAGAAGRPPVGMPPMPPTPPMPHVAPMPPMPPIPPTRAASPAGGAADEFNGAVVIDHEAPSAPWRPGVPPPAAELPVVADEITGLPAQPAAAPLNGAHGLPQASLLEGSAVTAAAPAADPGPMTEAGPATVFPGDLVRPLVATSRSVRLRMWLRRLLPAPGRGQSGRFGR